MSIFKYIIGMFRRKPTREKIVERLVKKLEECEHRRFVHKCVVYRLQDPEESKPHAFVAEVAVICAECDIPFQFLGMPSGNDLTKPMRAKDATTCRLPVTPPDRQVFNEDSRSTFA